MEIKVEKIKELNNNVILLSAKGMHPKDIEEQEKFLSEKTGKKVVIIDCRYEFIGTL